MYGINLKKKVNFKQSIYRGNEEEFKDQYIIEEHEPDKEPVFVIDSRVKCQYCGRLFLSELHAKHQNVCNKVFMGRRIPYDSQAQRLIQDDEEETSRNTMT